MYNTTKTLITKEHVIPLIEKALLVKDIFIITKIGKVVQVYDDAFEVLKFLFPKPFEEMKDYKICEFYWFLDTFIKDKNKYKTIGRFTIYKYNNTIKLGKKPDLETINNLSKDKMVINFLRERKLERICK